jgi:Uncharacterized protein conserved in bacteria
MQKQFLILLLAIGLLSACTVPQAAQPTPVATVKIDLHDPWVRTPAQGVDRTAFYVTIMNGSASDDALIAIKSDVAQANELHETVTEDNVMKMQPVSEVIVPAQGKVALQPGSFHGMLLNLNKELKAGDKVQIELTFKNAGQISVEAEVRDASNGGGH